MPRSTSPTRGSAPDGNGRRAAPAMSQRIAPAEALLSPRSPAEGGQPRVPARQALRTTVALVLFLVVVAVIWEVFKWLAGDPWRLTAIGYAPQAAVPPAPGVGPAAAAPVGHRRGSRGAGPAQPAPEPRPVPAGCRVLHLARGPPRLHRGHRHGHPARRRLRPLPGRGTCVRALRHRHPDDPHRGPGAPHRGQPRPGHCRPWCSSPPT